MPKGADYLGSFSIEFKLGFIGVFARTHSLKLLIDFFKKGRGYLGQSRNACM